MFRLKIILSSLFPSLMRLASYQDATVKHCYVHSLGTVASNQTFRGNFWEENSFSPATEAWLIHHPEHKNDQLTWSTNNTVLVLHAESPICWCKLGRLLTSAQPAFCSYSLRFEWWGWLQLAKDNWSHFCAIWWKVYCFGIYLLWVGSSLFVHLPPLYLYCLK